MLEKLRNRLLAFIESDKDTPLLAGFAVGFYMLLFYYSKNFALANSWQQLLFFVGYYIIIPCISLLLGYKFLNLLKLSRYVRPFLFVSSIAFFAFFILQLNTLNQNNLYFFAGVLAVALLLSFRFSKYYKALIPILFLISLFNVRPIAGAAYKFATASDEWKNLPDDIEKVVFRSKPNIYYIQPDGYTSFTTLKNSIHRFDNSDYEDFLKRQGFTLYDNFRSNYNSTLLSNSATFAMKHHYIASDIEFYGARNVIVNDNPVLRILRNNGYRSSFITEKSYLLVNRPGLGYDYCNIREVELPYIKDGLDTKKDIFADLKVQMKENSTSGNFYFLEKFTPGHIANFISDSKGAINETRDYLDQLRQANSWLKKVIEHITSNDPGAIIIVGADHGGFAGMNCTDESLIKITDKNQIYSIFGVQTAIRWSNTKAMVYDKEMKTSINLFRTVFSFLSGEEKYLEHMENDGSYIKLKDPAGVYKYINDDGNIIFEKIK